jgi:hypothetical protein
VNGEADLASITLVEIGMSRQEGSRFGRRRVAKAVDIMVPVALGMGDADQRAEREILLHGKPGLTGQVLACDKVICAIRAPFRGAGRVDDRFVDALAGFRGDAAIAKRARNRKRIVGIVGLVDDEAAAGERTQGRSFCDVARHRLLDIEQLCRNRLQRVVAIEAINQRAQRGEIGILLVGIQRDAIIISQRDELPADPDQAITVMRGIAVELELEIARARVFVCVGDPTLAFNPVIEPNRMPDRNALHPLPSGKELRDIVIAEIAR